MSKNKTTISIIMCLTLSTLVFGQLLEENFNYDVGTALTATGNWTAHSGSGSNPILVTEPGLTYSGYVGSGIGNAAKVDTTGEDVNRTFTAQTSGIVYAAFLVNVTKATTTGDYFFHFSTNPLNNTYFNGRIFVKKDASDNLAFGLSKYTEPATYSDSVYSLNTTYLLVLKYEIIAGTNNDIVSLFVFSSGVPSSEPGTPTIGPLSPALTDASNIGSVALRQGTASNAPRVIVDGIRVATTWLDALGITSGVATKLAITSVNNGISPSVNTPFNVVVQAQDALGNPANVTQNTDVQLYLHTGTGTLGGNLTGTIQAGTNTITISGVTYNTIETGVQIRVERTSGDILDPGISAPFNVYAQASQLVFTNMSARAQLNVKMAPFNVEAHRPDNILDPNYTDSVTITKLSGPGNVLGTLKKGCVGGIAIFDDIYFDEPGDYTLLATAPNLTSATSSTITVLPTVIPLIEDFDYTVLTSLTYNGWSPHSAAGSNPIMVTSPGLTYSGYLSSGIGNAANVIGGAGSREDVNRTFTPQTSGSVYAAFMVNVASAPTTEDYFLHFGPFSIGTMFRGRVFVKSDGGNLKFGLSKGSSTASVITNNNYSFNTTYLLVLKYTFNPGTNDDEVKLWINPPLSGTEPPADLSHTDGSISDLSNCGSIALRQGSNAYDLIVDGIRIGTSWGVLTGLEPPTIANITRSPLIPLSGESVTVLAKIYDDITPLADIADTLFYAVNTQTSWTAVLKTGYNSADSIFTYEIPALKSQGDTIFYKIHATDENGYTTISSISRYTIPFERTIDQIQGTTSASPDTFKYVHTKGIVTGTFGPRFFLEQRPGGTWNGLYVYRRPQDSIPKLNIGDSVSIIGIVKEYNTLTEIDAGYNLNGDVRIYASNRPLPCTTLQTISGVIEDYEGCLIRINDLHFKTTGTFASGTNYWAYNNDENDSIRIRIDANATEIIGQLIPNDTISIIGNLSAYKDTFQLLPRVWSDLFRPIYDVGATAILAPTGTVYQNSSVTPKVIVQNYGIATGLFPVVFEIGTAKDAEYLDTAWITLDVGQIDTVEFAPYQASVLGEFTTNAWTALPGDANPSNNSAPAGSFNVTEAPLVSWSWIANIIEPAPGKGVKAGGAMTAVETKSAILYAFPGNKSKKFVKYVDPNWTEAETIGFGLKYPVTDSSRYNKKVPGKGAALCWDGANAIYATKGNGTFELWKYDLDSAHWYFESWIPSTKGAKGGTSIFFHNGLLYVLVGGQKLEYENFFVYDPVGKSWTILNKAPAGTTGKPWKDGSAIVGIGGTIYGLKGGDKYNSFWAYNISGTNWTEIESCPQNHPQINKKTKVKDGGSMATNGSAVYMIKGGGARDFWKYEISKGTWVPLETIPQDPALGKKSVPKTGAALAYGNNYVYLLKGNNLLEVMKYGPVYADKLASAITPTTQTAIMTSEITTKLTFKFDVTPNPFTKLTTIRYTVPVSGKVSIKLYNATGRLIETITDGNLNAGSYTATLNAKNLTQGIYFLKYEDATNRAEIKLIVQ
ncbi:MAG: T9SS type A sorting domain-containing protein [candidate division WOR-3 bacterium]